ncbi:sigma-54-dependent Fis family transcriptional regulator, partial [bacterium]
FREDLYFRLNVFPIHIPPLRARKEDIPLLADYFIALYSSKNSKPVKEISSEALSWMMEYDWPGNVRELENAVERAVIISTGEEITQKDIVLPQMTGAKESADFGEILPIREMEKRLILKALEKTHGRRTEAARLLGISVRTLRNKLARYEKEGIYVNKMGEVRKEKN